MTTTDTTTTDPTEVEVTEPTGQTRRWALRAGGIGLVGAIVAACSGDDEGTETSETTDATDDSGNGDDASGDLAVAAVAASLEVLAVGTYDKALQAATSGALGEVPPAVAEFVTVAKAQHQEHLDGWNTALTDGGQEAVTEPPADLAAQVDETFAGVKDVVGAAQLALTLEETAAATYLAVLKDLSPAARGTAGSIICIDRQHAAVLRFVLGEYPVPDTFATTDDAYTPA